MGRVIIGRPSLEGLVAGKRLIGHEARTFVGERIDASAPTILGFELKSPAESVGHAQVQGIVVSVHVRGGKEYVGKRGIWRVKNEFLVNNAYQFTAVASFVAQAENKISRELCLALQRIIVDVVVREILGRTPNLHSPGERDSRGRVYARTHNRVGGIAVHGVAGAEHEGNLAVVKRRGCRG